MAVLRKPTHASYGSILVGTPGSSCVTALNAIGVKANCLTQNLLPLLLRPLRLVLSTQRLRSARIVLLKATHWPLVGLILMYERALTMLDDQRKFGYSGVSKRPSAPTSLRRPISRKPLSTSRLSLLEEQPRAARSPFGAPVPAPARRSESMERLSSHIAELQHQVKTLTDVLLERKT